MANNLLCLDHNCDETLTNGTVCFLPENNNIIKLDDNWTQILPDGITHITANKINTNGWAINPNFNYPCQDGGYCPYACQSGLIEVQYDNELGRPWWWEKPSDKSLSTTFIKSKVSTTYNFICPLSPTGPTGFICNSPFDFDNNICFKGPTGFNTIEYIGAGKRLISINNQSVTTGGKQGIHCVSGNKILDAPSNILIPEYNQQYCIQTPKTILVKNNTPFTIVFCRTVTPGSEDPQIPTIFEPYSHQFITTVPTCQNLEWANKIAPITCSKNNIAMWWTGGDINNDTVPIEYFLSRADEQSLIPICQWNSIRPSRYNTDNNQTYGGIDYYPYNLKLINATNLKLRANHHLFNEYDRSLGNPGYGVRIYTPNNKLIGSIEYKGPRDNSCSSLYEGCANDIVYPVIINDNGQIDSTLFELNFNSDSYLVNSTNPIIIELYDTTQISHSAVLAESVQPTTTNNKWLTLIIIIIVIIIVILLIIYFGLKLK